MIRPIDTQILYPQSPELSSRQQHTNQKATIEQNTFADAMKNETQQKQETVKRTNKDEKVANNNKEKPTKKHQKDKKKQKDNKEQQNKKNQTLEHQSRIDIRI